MIMISKKALALSFVFVMGVASNVSPSWGAQGQHPGGDNPHQQETDTQNNILNTEQAWQDHKAELIKKYKACMDPCVAESLLTEDFMEVTERCEEGCPNEAREMHEAEKKYSDWKLPQLFGKRQG